MRANRGEGGWGGLIGRGWAGQGGGFSGGECSGLYSRDNGRLEGGPVVEVLPSREYPPHADVRSKMENGRRLEKWMERD